MRKSLFLYSGFIIIIIASFFAYFLFRAPVFRGGEPLVVHFEKGMSASQLLAQIHKQRPIECLMCLKLYSKLSPSSHKLQAGYYRLLPDITPVAMFQQLAIGDVLIDKLTIKEGQTTEDVVATLDSSLYLAKRRPIDYGTFSQLKDCYLGREGLFLAETYFYKAGSEQQAVLARAHLALMERLQALWSQRAAPLPYRNVCELLTAASIVEKETAEPSERPLVAAVIINRLQKKMRLQMDPTVIYALGDAYHYPLTKENLSIDSHYNTYRYHGLPPGPIANVGEDALIAAAHPAKVDYLYFVAQPDGRHVFSTTLEQQIKAIHQAKTMR